MNEIQNLETEINKIYNTNNAGRGNLTSKRSNYNSFALLLHGYSLFRKSDGKEVAKWEAMPKKDCEKVAQEILSDKHEVFGAVRKTEIKKQVRNFD